MKSANIGWAFGALAALGMGMAAEACSSSSSTSVTGVDGGGTNTGTATGTAASTGTSNGASSTGTGANTGTAATSADGGTCYHPPRSLFALDGSTGPYCPFSGVGDGGKNINCDKGQHCCEPGAKFDMPSTCYAGGTACPSAVDPTDWVCEGTPDCSGQAGTICCGQGVVKQNPPQPGCGDGGTTLAPFPYVSGFYATACQKSCDAFGDGGVGFQVCSKTSECPVGQTCVAVEPKGNTIGYCTVVDGGAGNTGSSSSAATTTSSTAASTTGASSTTGGTTTTSKASSSHASSTH